MVCGVGSLWVVLLHGLVGAEVLVHLLDRIGAEVLVHLLKGHGRVYIVLVQLVNRMLVLFIVEVEELFEMRLLFHLVIGF